MKPHVCYLHILLVTVVVSVGSPLRAMEDTAARGIGLSGLSESPGRSRSGNQAAVAPVRSKADRGQIPWQPHVLLPAMTGAKDQSPPYVCP